MEKMGGSSCLRGSSQLCGVISYSHKAFKLREKVLRMLGGVCISLN